MRENFILHKAQIDPIMGLTTQEKGLLLEAIISYQFEGKITVLPPMLSLAFGFIKSQLDIDNRRYLTTCERNRDNGKKGGRPKKSPEETQKPSGYSEKPKNPPLFSETQKPDNDNDNDNGNEEVKKRSRFSPPPLFEIEDYFKEQIKSKGLLLNPKLEAEKFESFYSSKNWYVGKNKMAVWKKAAIGWISRIQTDKPSVSKAIVEPVKGLKR